MVETRQEPNVAMHTLRNRIGGPVYGSADGGYDAERTGFQLLGPHRPDVVVGATGEADVRAAVEYAAACGSRVAVQARGHGLTSALDGGVLISTGRMSGVRVDPERRTAWIEAGARWSDVIAAAGPHGLAPLSGSLPGVGAVSYTLGGGVGLLARRYGFAADHVRAVDLVTVDGQRLRVTVESEPELFWALRGGGGNFGVVTAMEVDLVPVSRILGGAVYFDVRQVPDVLDAWRRWTRMVPEEMTSAVSMLPFPDVSTVPDALRGRHVAQVQVSYLGTEHEGGGLVGALREIGPCLRDTVRELPYTESAVVFDEPDQPHAYRSRNLVVRDLDPESLASLPESAGPSAPVMSVVGLRHLGGALARAPEPPNAVGHRDAEYVLSVLSPVETGQQGTVSDAHDKALAPFADRAMGRSLNFSFGPLDTRQVREAFTPADYRRLVAVKRRYDPDGLLHCNHPLPTASAG